MTQHGTHLAELHHSVTELFSSLVKLVQFWSVKLLVMPLNLLSLNAAKWCLLEMIQKTLSDLSVKQVQKSLKFHSTQPTNGNCLFMRSIIDIYWSWKEHQNVSSHDVARFWSTVKNKKWMMSGEQNMTVLTNIWEVSANVSSVSDTCGSMKKNSHLAKKTNSTLTTSTSLGMIQKNILCWPLLVWCLWLILQELLSQMQLQNVDLLVSRFVF